MEVSECQEIPETNEIIWDPFYSQFKYYYITSDAFPLVSVLWISGYFSCKCLADITVLPLENREGRTDKEVLPESRWQLQKGTMLLYNSLGTKMSRSDSSPS